MNLNSISFWNTIKTAWNAKHVNSTITVRREFEIFLYLWHICLLQ